MLTVVLLCEEGKKTNASREVPSSACTWEATAKDGCGGEAAQGEERAGGRRGPTAHLSVHLDRLGLQGSAPSPPERLLVRPPGRPARPTPQLERVAPHHEEAPILGPRRAAAGQRRRPDLAESPGRQQRYQGEEEGESRLPPAAPCRHVRANATAGGAAARRECAARGRDAGRPGPRAPLPGLQAALLRPPPPGPALLGAAPSRGRLAAAAPSRTFSAAAPPPRGDGEVKAAGARPGPLAGATRRPCALRQPGVAWGSSVLPGVLASSTGSRRGRPQPRPVSSPDCTASCPATRPPRPPPVASPPPGERGQPEKISSEDAAGTLESR